MNAPSRYAPTVAAAALVVCLCTADSASAAPPLVTATTTADIHDIRGPKPISSPWLLPLLALTGLAAVGGTYAAWAWNRGRLRDTPQLPHEIALARLDTARTLIAAGQAREFSIAVTDIVRGYIESRFEVRAAHLTTDEFLRTLSNAGDTRLAAYRPLLDEFLNACDLAKFGGWNLSATEMDMLLQSARRFVIESQPAARAAPAVPESAATRRSYASLPAT